MNREKSIKVIREKGERLDKFNDVQLAHLAGYMEGVADADKSKDGNHSPAA